MPGNRFVLPAMGLGLAPMPGGADQSTRHGIFALRPLSKVALVRYANVPGRPAGAPISGTRSSRASRRCSLPPSALLRCRDYGLRSQGVLDGLFRSVLR
jgi:hypothetical protein